MITVYHLPLARSMRVLWLLEEVGEPYRVEPLTIPVSEDYLKINPLGSIPTIDDDGVRLFESIAILQYLAARLPAAARLAIGPAPDPAAFAEYLQFLHFGEADLSTPISAIFRTRLATGDDAHNNPTLEQLTQKVERRLAFLDAHMGDGRPYVAGNDLTLADISIGYILWRAQGIGLGELLTGRLINYAARLEARPAFRRAAAR